MTSVKTWRMLVRVKQRRLQRQDEVVAEALASVRECEAGLEKARSGEQRRQSQFTAAQDTLRQLYAGEQVFTPELALMRKRQIDAAEQDLRQAQHETSVHQQRVATVTEDLREARAHLERLRQQAKTFQEQLDKTLQTEALAQEDQQDEDAEETAVARLLSLARAA